MPQRSQNDVRVIDLIKSERITVDAKSGMLFGRARDLYGHLRGIGYKDKNEDRLFSYRYENKCFVSFICRAVWLKVNGIIPDGLVVSHKDKNKGNNSIDNLGLKKDVSKSYNPKFWSEAEVQWLKDNYEGKSLSQLSDGCGRSIKAVRHKIKLIHLSPKKGKNKPWSEAENKQLIDMYSKKMSAKEISQKMNRTEPSVRLQANRKLGVFRSDRHLQLSFRSEKFYLSLKAKIARKTAGSKCCLCDYSKHIQLHHIDGNNKNHGVENIASLCPNHHVEVEHEEHVGKELYCIWWRIYSDGSITPRNNNLEKIREKSNEEKNS